MLLLGGIERDTVSSFLDKGKKTAMAIWRCFPEAAESFPALTSHLSDINQNLMSNFQCFVVLLYDRGSTTGSFNVARKQLFVQKGRQFDSIPLKEAVLKTMSSTLPTKQVKFGVKP